MRRIENTNIESQSPLPPPDEVKRELPLPKDLAETVLAGRDFMRSILDGRDKRLLVIVGPCSIHSEEGTLEYAARLRDLSAKVSKHLFLVMRAYFEKPRTTLGWKGLIYDPELNGSYNIEAGLKLARKLLLGIVAEGVPTATEVLDPIMAQYIADLISWAAIGARTTESQMHRQLASGLSMPVGFKNSTDGSIRVAVEAIKTAAAKHSFIGITGAGNTAVFRTKGNKYCHLVLRGGAGDPNYGSEHIAFACELMRKSKIHPSIVIDCSHANSARQPERQLDVLRDVLQQRSSGNESLRGVMLESNLKTGRQELQEGRSPEPGISITDPCLGWEETEAALLDAARFLGRQH
ncbi:MAG: 3-deoxy-7-phosphoheptulonate synthase [Lentisphaerae bacterium GWF2_52_8]|nr:MAG: 3-deoxy-7-phosphoheptulonate synthase [Lentisphaerae bacterium GWF2_52_8]